MSEFKKTPLNKIKRSPNRAQYDRDQVFGILDSHFLCHVSYVFDGTALSIPTAYGRDGDTLFLHGAFRNRMLFSLLENKKVSLTVTHMDGIVLARSVFHSSFNYRSVVVFGTPRLVDDNTEKNEALRVITDSIAPGRWMEARQPSDNELKVTTVIALDITEASAKIRTGPPKDEEEDYDLDIWAGVVPLKLVNDIPVPDDVLGSKISVPASVHGYQLRG